MSYADMAAKGPKQSDDEVRTTRKLAIIVLFKLTIVAEVGSMPLASIMELSRAKTLSLTHASRMPHQIPEIMHEDSGVHSLDSLDSREEPRVQSIPSYADQQKAAEEAEAAAESAEQEAKDFGKKAKSSAKELEGEAKDTYSKASKDAKDTYSKVSKDAKDTYSKVKKEAGIEGEKAKREAKEAGEWADKNKGNPVVLGNTFAVVALGGLLGYGAYRKHAAGELTWKVAGAWAGVVGLFAVGDYFASSWLFKNRYPPKN